MRLLSSLPFLTCALLHFGVAVALPKPPAPSNLSLREPVHSNQAFSSSAPLILMPRSTATVFTERQEDGFVTNEPPTTAGKPQLPATEHASANHISRSDNGKDPSTDDELHNPVSSREHIPTVWPKETTTSERDSWKTYIGKRKENERPLVAEAVIGAVAFFAFAGLGIFIWIKCRRQKKAQKGAA